MSDRVRTFCFFILGVVGTDGPAQSRETLLFSAKAPHRRRSLLRERLRRHARESKQRGEKRRASFGRLRGSHTHKRRRARPCAQQGEVDALSTLICGPGSRRKAVPGLRASVGVSVEHTRMMLLI